MLGQATYLDLIPGARAGVSYLMGQVANFQRLPSRFTQIETAAIATKRAAESRSNLVVATQLALALQGVAKLREQWSRTSSRLADVLEGLRTAGLGLTPIELGTLAARVAAEMTGLFKGADGLQSSVYSAASKVMSASEIAAMKLAAPAGAAQPMTPFLKYALFGGLLYGAVLVMGKGKRGRRAHARS